MTTPTGQVRAMSYTDMDRTVKPTNEVVDKIEEGVEHPTSNPKNVVNPANATDKKGDAESQDVQPDVFNPNHTVTYKGVVKILKDSYNFDETVTSTSLDILALYLKGQKIIYTESKTYCEKRLNTLMLPAIFIAAVCSILNFILKDINYGTIIISALNAGNSFILSIINYLKLAEKSQNHLMAAQRFHNLESRIELKSGRSLFFNESVDIEQTLEEIEKEIKEIQSSDQFIVPEAIRYRYPKIYSANLFSLVKQIKNEEMLIINELKSAVQEIYLHIEQKNQLIEREKEVTLKIKTYRNQLLEYELEKELLELHFSNDMVFDDERGNGILIVADDPKEKERLQFERDHEEKKREERQKENLAKRQELLQVKIKYKHCQNRLKQAEIILIDVKQSINEEKQYIKINDSKKDDAFERSVQHRQKYIDLSDMLNREINQHITKTNKCCRCNPCDFFNT